jgi:hypothetical protein
LKGAVAEVGDPHLNALLFDAVKALETAHFDLDAARDLTQRVLRANGEAEQAREAAEAERDSLREERDKYHASWGGARHFQLEAESALASAVGALERIAQTQASDHPSQRSYMEAYLNMRLIARSALANQDPEVDDD